MERWPVSLTSGKVLTGDFHFSCCQELERDRLAVIFKPCTIFLEGGVSGMKNSKPIGGLADGGVCSGSRGSRLKWLSWFAESRLWCSRHFFDAGDNSGRWYRRLRYNYVVGCQNQLIIDPNDEHWSIWQGRCHWSIDRLLRRSTLPPLPESVMDFLQVL